jgi:UDP-N-acetylglucosamine--N-acetylmuramyl-(pentapeptide) pyrophosphoryl-undecaprenol N-acetylglucosamine transferase
VRSFTSFPTTHGLERGEWVGNPVRRSLAEFDRERLRGEGMSRYQLAGSSPVLGIFGGSLGAGVINAAARELVSSWRGPAMQVVHLTGQGHGIETEGDSLPVTWRRIEFEERMDLFYAVADLVVARAGGGVAELTATGTPAILIPGEFGSSGHQTANAAFLRDAGAAVVLAQDRIEELAGTVNRLLFDKPTLNRMREAAEGIARPRAASTIASAMLGLAG